MKPSIFILCFLFLAFACQQKSETPPVPTKDFSIVKDSLTTALQNANKESELVGFSVAIIDPDRVLYTKGFGHADSKNKKVYQTNTIQNIGSISKTLIGISLFKAQELGKLNIDDPINNYLPFEVTNPNHPDTPIPIRQLATHTSSINDYTKNYLKGYILEKDTLDDDEEPFTHFQKSDKRIPLLDFLEASFSTKGSWYTTDMFSENKPGSTFDYSNFGADLCALVIQQATGMLYKDFTQKYILDPLQMENSGWAIKDIDDSKRSKFYLFKGQKIADYTCITYPDGGLFTSSEDLSKFLSELMKGYQGNGTLLSPESYKEFYKKHFDSNINESGRINVGTFVEYNNSFIGTTNLLIGHNGSDLGSFATMYFNPETNIGKVILINTDIDYKDDVVVPYIKDVWNTIVSYENKLK
jgi:CubicO group peptidase (beta-lactamase class C family)